MYIAFPYQKSHTCISFKIPKITLISKIHLQCCDCYGITLSFSDYLKTQVLSIADRACFTDSQVTTAISTKSDLLPALFQW